MPFYKATWFFEARSTGWSESMYTQADDADGALTRSKALGQIRMDMCGLPADVQMTYVRVANQSAPFETEPEDVEILSTSDLGALDCDMPWIGVKVGIQAGDAHRRILILRGIPDEITHQSWDVKVQSASFAAHFAVWKDAISGRSWYLKTLDKTLPLQQIVSITPNQNNTVSIDSPAHGLSSGDLISFSRVKCKGVCLRGVHRVIFETFDVFRIEGVNVSRTYFEYGNFRKLAYTFSQITDASYGGTRKRKTGRPFGLLHGRRGSCK